MYELYIKKDSAWVRLDVEQGSVAYNIANYDITSLDVISANYSQNIELKRTQTNVSAFDFIINPQANRAITRKYLPCLLLNNGINIAGDNSVMMVLSVTNDAINVQILSSLFDLFSSLKEMDLKTEVNDVTGDDVLGILTLPLDSIPSASGGVRYINQMGVGGGKVVSDTNAGGFYQWAMPLLRYDSLVTKVLARLGYSFNSDADNSNIYVGLTGRKAYVGRGNLYEKIADDYYYKDIVDETQAIRFHVGKLYKTSMGVEPTIDGKKYIEIEAVAYSTNLDDEYPQSPIYQEYHKYTETYEIGTAGIYLDLHGSTDTGDVEYHDSIFDYSLGIIYGLINTTGSNYERIGSTETQGIFRKRIRLYYNYFNAFNGAVYYSIYDTTTNAWTTPIKTADTPLYMYDGYIVSQIGFTTQNGGDIRARLIYDDGTSVQVAGGQISISNNIGFSTASDLVKQYCLALGLHISIDEKNKIVNFRQFENIKSNKASAFDISNMIDMSSLEYSYRADVYGQQNTITLEKNSKDESVNSVTIAIADGTLDVTKSFLSLPFESTPVNEIPYWYIDNDSALAYKELSNPALMCLTSNKFTNVMDVIQSKYDTIFAAFADYFMVKCNMLLNFSFLVKYDTLIPVYVTQFGSYFYINKINNYMEGQLTECELIRIVI